MSKYSEAAKLLALVEKFDNFHSKCVSLLNELFNLRGALDVSFDEFDPEKYLSEEREQVTDQLETKIKRLGERVYVFHSEFSKVVHSNDRQVDHFIKRIQESCCNQCVLLAFIIQDSMYRSSNDTEVLYLSLILNKVYIEEDSISGLQELID